VMFANLRKFFSWCVEREYLEVSPCLGMNSPGSQAVRDRWLSGAELGLVWRAACSLGWPFGPLYRFLILTAQRRSEVSDMRWSEVDLAAAEWTIPAVRAKNRRAHLVDLSPEAVDLLKGLKRDGDLIFSTTGSTGASGHSHAKARWDEAVEELRKRDAVANGIEPPSSPISGWRLHDLRRTAATGMARLGNRPEVVEAVLNHVSGARGGLVAVYQHYDHRPERKAALLAWARHVSGLVSAPAPHKDDS
jgi:integrase